VKDKSTGTKVKELAVLLALLVPGGGLFFWGLASCASAHHLGMPGAAGVALGLCLTFAGGYYHYRTDYRGVGTGRTFLSFSASTALCALAAFLVNRLLFH
jgi:hypothetical protein